jgi:hypothetical protein
MFFVSYNGCKGYHFPVFLLNTTSISNMPIKYITRCACDDGREQELPSLPEVIVPTKCC